jgi:predicted transglutaminase-like cysteine proteinase
LREHFADSSLKDGQNAFRTTTRVLEFLSPDIYRLLFAFFYVLFFCIKGHAQTAIDEPFGLSTMPAAQTAIRATWKELLIEITNDLSIINTCRENPQSCSSLAAINFVNIAKAGERHEGLARIGHLNRAVNLAIRAVNTDEWKSPLAILSSGTGDCKHYAVLKYAMLRELGVSPDFLKIIVVEVRSIHQQHAILAVRTEEGRWLLLDNRTLMLVESSMALDYYDPLYELDQNGVRLFESSPRSPQLAQSPSPTQTR